MAYIRKGGKGFDADKSLKQQFNYYKKQLFNRLIKEQAMKEVVSGFSFSGTIYTTFENLDFNKIMKEGITRKVVNKTVRITGEEAVKIQIESMKKRASKSQQANQYIDNYTKALKQMGMPMNLVEKITNKMHSISSDNLTFIVEENILPSISYIYSDEISYEDLADQILFALNSKMTSEQKEDVRNTSKDLENIIKKRMQREGKF